MAGRRADNSTVEAMRSALRGKTGRVFWRSLDELTRTPTFVAFLESEFPALAAAQHGVDRRSMLKALAASLAFAGLAGCEGKPDESALPYVDTAERQTPGNPRWYATAVTPFGYAQPVLGKTYAGRPVKLEGNPDHPASQGATDAFTQAALLGLYDPSRSQFPRYLGEPATWDALDAAVQTLSSDMDARHGDGFRLLTGATTSPTVLRQISALLDRWPDARWHVLEPVNDDARLEASRSAFGRTLEPHYQLETCELLVSFDDDLLGPGPRQLVHGLGWSKRRQARQARNGDCRLLVAEPTPSATGAMASRRLPASPQRMGAMLSALGHMLGADQGSAPELSADEQGWLQQCADGLRLHRGRALVTVGPHHPAALHAYALELNNRLGNLNSTLRFTDPIVASAAQPFEALVRDMADGQVSALWILDVNAAYLASPDVGLKAALDRIKLKLHAGLHHDETAAACHWHLPASHELESWSDARAVDGTASIVQPLVRPLYATRSHHELLDRLLNGSTEARQIVRQTWQASWNQDFDRRWTESLQRGLIEESAPPFVQAALKTRAGPPQADQTQGLTAVIRPDPTIWDGRFSGNAWLQELPKPLSKVTWGNVVGVSPKLAADHKLRNGDEIRIEHDGRSIRGPIWVMPGQDDRCVTLSLGYGESQPDSAEEPSGYNALAFRSVRDQWHLAGITLAATGETLAVASTQLHQAMDGFDFVRTIDASKLDAPRAESPEPPSFYPAKPISNPSWGMSIDLDLCIGCNACVVACIAENNIPMVGKDLVAQGREMHWLRIDHYHEGDPANPRSYFQPVPCMHCEQAPCEMGCPVNAAVHSSDGLNLQVYNRCIGTRTCSSFCPYKVRHFNWFDYTGDDPESVRAMRNPDVTVRARGVMEKCTYCVQRIQEAKIAAQVAGRALRDGDVVTACQQACPTQAIIFGNVTETTAAVSRRKASNRSYSLLEEANTRPRTTYLARIEDGAPAPGKS
jgi:molybdopterin-containing oxidoreductase family iron-sulfur binding subunit